MSTLFPHFTPYGHTVSPVTIWQFWDRGITWGAPLEHTSFLHLPSAPPFPLLDHVLLQSHLAHLFHDHWLQEEADCAANPLKIHIPLSHHVTASSVSTEASVNPSIPVTSCSDISACFNVSIDATSAGAPFASSLQYFPEDDSELEEGEVEEEFQSPLTSPSPGSCDLSEITASEPETSVPTLISSVPKALVSLPFEAEEGSHKIKKQPLHKAVTINKIPLTPSNLRPVPRRFKDGTSHPWECFALVLAKCLLHLVWVNRLILLALSRTGLPSVALAIIVFELEDVALALLMPPVTSAPLPIKAVVISDPPSTTTFHKRPHFAFPGDSTDDASDAEYEVKIIV
ncbi:hypothetical protein C8J56DRAFT_903062 [Mycena floridula]|nr:hypothetical protein C8J56DRAFT_903062 [Mycena floridula]